MHIFFSKANRSVGVGRERDGVALSETRAALLMHRCFRTSIKSDSINREEKKWEELKGQNKNRNLLGIKVVGSEKRKGKASSSWASVVTYIGKLQRAQWRSSLCQTLCSSGDLANPEDVSVTPESHPRNRCGCAQKEMERGGEAVIWQTKKKKKSI